MDRMKTFGMYAIWIVLFFLFSTLVSNVLLKNSYNDIEKLGGVNISSSEEGLSVETVKADSNKMSGTYRGKITNTSDKSIDSKYVRIKSYSSGGNLLQTKYVKLEDLKPGETREFNARFDVGGIDHYDVDYVDEMPDDSTFLDKQFDKVRGFLKSDDKLGFLKNWFGGSDGVFGGYKIRTNSVDLPPWAWIISGWIVFSSLPAGFFIL